MLTSWTTLPEWQAIGWTMIHFLWIGTLVGLVTFVGRLALHRCRPQMRYVFLVGCFVLLAAAPWPLLWHLLSTPAPSSSPGALGHGISRFRAGISWCY